MNGPAADSQPKLAMPAYLRLLKRELITPLRTKDRGGEVNIINTVNH